MTQVLSPERAAEVAHAREVDEAIADFERRFEHQLSEQRGINALLLAELRDGAGGAE